MSIIGVSPLELDADRRLVIVDMRPTHERVSELGFIPGSILLPYEDRPLPYASKLAHLASSGPVVLACVSGRRSGLTVAALEPLLGPTRHLEGGLLAWGAAGFPLCHAERHEVPVADLRTALRSTFVAEVVQFAVEADVDVDPLGLLAQAFEACGFGASQGDVPSGSRGAWCVLDRAGAALRELGVDSDRIVTVLEPLYGQVA